MVAGILIDPDGAEKRKKEARERFFYQAGLKKTVSYDGKRAFRPPPRSESILSYQLGIVEEKRLVAEVVDAFRGNADLAMKFLASRNDLVKANEEAKATMAELEAIDRELLKQPESTREKIDRLPG